MAYKFGCVLIRKFDGDRKNNGYPIEHPSLTKMRFDKLLNVGKFNVQLIWMELIQFWIIYGSFVSKSMRILFLVGNY